MYRARDVMSKNVEFVYTDTPIEDALKKLVEKDMTGMPVLDKDKKLAGIVSEKDMLILLQDPCFGENPVSAYMSSEIVAFEEDDDVIDICDCLMNSKFRRVPIIDENKKVIGIISRRDIIRFILKVREENQ